MGAVLKLNPKPWGEGIVVKDKGPGSRPGQAIRVGKFFPCGFLCHMGFEWLLRESCRAMKVVQFFFSQP